MKYLEDLAASKRAKIILTKLNLRYINDQHFFASELGLHKSSEKKKSCQLYRVLGSDINRLDTFSTRIICTDRTVSKENFSVEGEEVYSMFLEKGDQLPVLELVWNNLSFENMSKQEQHPIHERGSFQIIEGGKQNDVNLLVKHDINDK